MNIEKLELRVANSNHITNSYLVYDDNKNGILIDPADEYDKIINKIKELNLNIEYIILTHAHFDHINALYDMKKYTKAKVLVHKEDLEMLIGKIDNASTMFNAKNKYLNENEITVIEDGFCFNIGNLKFEIIHTPGHTAGSIIIFEKENDVIFSGDTLFSNSYGRTDLATGNFDELVKSLRIIFNKFDNKDIMVYPGHGQSNNLGKIKRYVTLLLALKKINL